MPAVKNLDLREIWRGGRSSRHSAQDTPTTACPNTTKKHAIFALTMVEKQPRKRTKQRSTKALDKQETYQRIRRLELRKYFPVFSQEKPRGFWYATGGGARGSVVSSVSDCTVLWRILEGVSGTISSSKGSMVPQETSAMDNGRQLAEGEFEFKLFV